MAASSSRALRSSSRISVFSCWNSSQFRSNRSASLRLRFSCGVSSRYSSTLWLFCFGFRPFGLDFGLRFNRFLGGWSGFFVCRFRNSLVLRRTQVIRNVDGGVGA